MTVEESFADRVEESRRMISAFAAVGCRHFDITQTNVDRQVVTYRPGRNLPAVRITLLPYLIPRAWTLAENLIVRPQKPQDAILAQLDDLKAGTLERARELAFLAVETSTGNYQAWVAIEGASDHALAGRLVAAMGSDARASCSGRLAGSPNCKPKYAPDWPRVRIVEERQGYRVAAAEVERLVGPPPPRIERPARAVVQDGQSRGWPDYEKSIKGAPLRADGRIDRSKADYFWCMWALERGNRWEDVAARLAELSEKAREEKARGNDKYATRTAERAWRLMRRR